jgi:NAD(P)-dependent dehydrogenase (short-subunit alcohol dehydrogenase family)
MYHNIFSLKNKLAFILGGEGLIGKEIVRAISENSAKTIILDKDAKGANILPNTIYEQFDCTNLNHIEDEIELLINRYGSPDIFINCSYPRTEKWSNSSFKKVDLDLFRKNIDIHLNTYSWIAKIISDNMVKSEIQGSIIQFGSIYGVLGQDLTVYENTDMEENMIYSVIKGGIINLSRQMASYYGQYQIRVNTICPGGIRGPVAGKSDTQDPIFVKQYSKKTPLKRMGRPEDIAPLVVFLASDASSYITGQTVMVDGGWTAI